MIDELEDDLPEFSARSLDDVDEGVGEVRVVTSRTTEDEGGFDSYSSSDEAGYAATAEASSDEVESHPSGSQPADEPANNEQAGKQKGPKDIIVLYILPKADPNNQQTLLGAQINSSAQAMGLSFGDMNIFHYTVDGRNVFSLANMLEPGSFDPDTIHELRTTGLTVFMQLHKGDPMDDLTEMLQRSYQLAGLLDARLCNHKRETLTEQDAENYRQQVREFVSATEPELSS